MTTSPMHKGFTALISAIIISVILLGLAVALSGSTFFARFNALNREYKRISLGLAEACVNAALAKISLDYDYVVPPGGEIIPLDPVYGRDTECLIEGPSSAPSEVAGKKQFDIRTSASYAGAFSSLSVSASAQDPEEAPVVPPPNCSLTSSPTSVPLGQSVNLLWSATTNADTMTIDHSVGSVNPHTTSGPWEVVTPSSTGEFTYIATVGNEGGTNTCETTFTITAPPPAPACADTVMMLDRSYSMFGYPDYPSGYSQWVPNERAAAKTLIDLYDGVASNPKVGWGRIGDLGSGRGAELVEELSFAYSSLKNSIDAGMPQNPIGYTNLGQAINVAAAELESARHDPDKKKVLIFVSDGLPNEPTSGVPVVTSTSTPTAQTQNGSGDSWANPTGAYDTGQASDTDGHRHRYYNFNIPTLPSGASVTGILAAADAWSTPGMAPLIAGYFSPSAQTSDTGGDGNGFESNPTRAYVDGGGNNGYALNGNGAGDRHRYYNYNISVPSGSQILGIEVRPDWWTDSTSGTNSVSVELSWNGGTTWTAAKQQTTETTNDTDAKILGGPTDTWGRTWTTNDFSNTNFRVRITSNSTDSNRDFSLDWLPVRVHYLGPEPSSNCQLGMDLSWNGGSNWSNEKTVTLGATNAVYSFGGRTDTWSRSWSTGDFSNGNFRMRVRDIDPGSSCGAAAVTNVDQLKLQVFYTVPVNPTQYARDAASDAKNDDVDIFSIHFGDTDGLDFMAELASASSIPSSSIVSATRSGGTATITTSGPHRLTPNQRVSISGVSGGSYNGTFTVTSVSNATTFRYSLSGTGSGSGGSATPRNLFVSPSTGAMDDIFESIGYQVCPAAAKACGNLDDDDNDGLIDDADPGCHDDGDETNPSSYDADDSDEWDTSPIPLPPPPPPPPPNIDIGSWIEL